MALRKIQKILLIAGVALVVVQVPWYFAVQAYVNKTQNRTTATVVKIVSMDAGCTGDWIGRPDPTCDHSPREYPVYEYYDDRGQKHQQDDRFLGEYKQR